MDKNDAIYILIAVVVFLLIGGVVLILWFSLRKNKTANGNGNGNGNGIPGCTDEEAANYDKKATEDKFISE